MQALPEASQRFAKVSFVSFAVDATCVETAKVNAAGETVLNIANTGGPAVTIISYVVFHASKSVSKM